jgi:hypothetical protein
MMTLTKLTPLWLIAVIFVITGCASTPQSQGAGGQAEVVVPARIASAVTVPAESARKIVLTMTGPAMVVDAKDWPEMKREWRETFADHAKAAGIDYEFADVPPAFGQRDGTLLEVYVSDYRIVGIGMRILFGIMTGNAYIDADVGFVNLRDGSKFGDHYYKTTSSAAGGIFAKMTPQQVDKIATNVFIDFKAAK